jgi:hypothetical protein
MSRQGVEYRDHEEKRRAFTIELRQEDSIKEGGCFLSFPGYQYRVSLRGSRKAGG